MAVRETTRENYTAELATQRSHARDEMQQNIDSKTLALVTEWDAADQPTDGSLFVNFETDDAADGKRRVRRSFNQDALKTRDPKLAPMWYKDGAPDDEGWIVLQYSVRHVVAGEKSEDDSNGNGNGETPADAPAEGAAPDAPADETPDAPADETPADDAPAESEDAPQPSGRFRGRR